MLNFFVRRPVTTVVFVLFWAALGITSFSRTNVERLPDIDLPLVSVTFTYPGASPLDIESLVVKRAENAISEVAGLKKIIANVFENGAFVMAEFNFGVNVNDKASEIKTKIDALAGEFPEDMDKPVVEKINPLQEPVIDLVISGVSARDIAQFVDDVLSQQITAIPGVASVSVFGGRERAVRVQLSPELMAERGATITDIVGAMAASNLNLPGGKIERLDDSNAVRFDGEFSSVDEISDLLLTTAEGARFKLSEIAAITDGTREAESGAKYNGEDVVIVSVVRASDGNAIKISQALRKNFERFEGMMNDYFRDSPTRPSMKIIYDSSTTISNETADTIYSIVLGVVLTALTLLAFTGNWRTTVIAAVVIPASLVSGFFFMELAGFTINSMTLLAMATALGTLISSAIVLIESSLMRLDAGDSPKEAAINGTKEATVPVLAASGTNLVVFLPLAFMGGIAGQFMKPFGMTVVFLTLLSLLFSFTLTPMMIAKILRRKPKKSEKSQWSLEWFRKAFDWQLKFPIRFIIASVAVLVMSAFLMRWVGNEFQPSTDVNEITITARAPVGTTYARTEQIAAEIQERVAKFPEVEYTSAKLGERGLQNITMKIGLVPRADRDASDKEIAQMMLPKLAEIPGVEIQIAAGERNEGDKNDMVMNVTGLDDERREAYARDILERLNRIPEIQSAVLKAQTPGDELRFVPDTEKMQYWGVSNRAAAAALRAALFGDDSLKYKENGKEYPIIIEFSKEYKTRSMFGSVFVQTPKGLVALSSLGAVQTQRAVSDINRENKMRITEIDINIGKSTIGPVQAKIQAELDAMEFAPGYGAVFGGLSEMQEESNAEIGQAFLLATVLTYMLLAGIMNSVLHPFTVATSILFSFAGVFILLFLTGASINIAAMMAIVMLVGLAVNNNILVLEPMIGRIAKGEEVGKALWGEYSDNTRMLFMSTFAVAAGMAPQLWSHDGVKLSMGAVIIGGMLASLFWTYAVTPALFVSMERLRRRFL